MRKIVQIACSESDTVEATQCHVLLYALCDDGTLWVLLNNAWKEIQNVPQE